MCQIKQKWRMQITLLVNVVWDPSYYIKHVGNYVSSPNKLSHVCKFENIELSLSLERADIKLSYDA